MGKKKKLPAPERRGLPGIEKFKEKAKEKPVPPPPPPPPPMFVKRVGDALHLEDLFKIKDDKGKLKKCYKSFWESPESFARHIESIDKTKVWHDSGWEDNGDLKWYGTKTMKEALDLARQGWKEGMKKASRLLGKIMAANPLMKKPKKYGIAGSHPNVPKAIAGDVMNMHVPDPRKASRRPVITLLSDMAATCGHGGEELINRAAVVAAIIDHIEAAGYACDVIAFAASRGYSGLFSDGDTSLATITAVQVKNSNQPVDIARLSYGLGHAAMFRRLVFAEVGSDDFCRGLGRGLGTTLEVKIDKGLAEDGIFVVPSVEGTDIFKTEEKAEKEGLKYLIKSLKDQGLPVFEGVDLENVQAEVIKKKVIVDSDF